MPDGTVQVDDEPLVSVVVVIIYIIPIHDHYVINVMLDKAAYLSSFCAQYM